MADGLRDDEALHASAVVANSAMNRERELGFNPLAWLVCRTGAVSWLDLCCGTGRALGQAADRLANYRAAP